MAKNSQTPQTPKGESAPVIVAGHKVHEGTVLVIFKDAVNVKNPLFRAKAEKTGSVWCQKGVTLEEVKSTYPIGTRMPAIWGEEIESEFGGLFEIEGL